MTNKLHLLILPINFHKRKTSSSCKEQLLILTITKSLLRGLFKSLLTQATVTTLEPPQGRNHRREGTTNKDTLQTGNQQYEPGTAWISL